MDQNSFRRLMVKALTHRFVFLILLLSMKLILFYYVTCNIIIIIIIIIINVFMYVILGRAFIIIIMPVVRS